MKTSELKERLEAFISYLNGKLKTPKGLRYMYKYRVVDYGNRVAVERKFEQGTSETWFEIDKENEILTGIDVDTTLTVDEMDFYDYMSLFGTVNAYFNTPLEERKDEQRWYIHLLEDSDKYLNLYKDPNIGYRDPDYKGHYTFDDKDEGGSYQTEFTRSEIEDWAGTNSDEIIDWIIGKFGEEVE